MNTVGPVLVPGVSTDAVIAAIKKTNKGVLISDFGAYVRVSVKDQCVLRAEMVEAELGQKFKLPADLEPLMPSFKGIFTVNEHEAIWSHKKP